MSYTYRYIEEQERIVRAEPGACFATARADAIVMAVTEGVAVRLLFNDDAYQVDPRRLEDTVIKLPRETRSEP